MSSPCHDLWQEQPDKPESYRGILYSLNKAPYTMPVISKSSLPELSSVMPRSFQSFGALGAPTDRLSMSKTLDVYVCTHGARDCRCGDIGSDLVRALRATAPPDVRVFDIAHVGGHKCVHSFSDRRPTNAFTKVGRERTRLSAWRLVRQPPPRRHSPIP